MDINKLLLDMTVKEKISLLDGKDSWHTKDIKRLNIPSIMMTDGPHGIRKEVEEHDQHALNASYPATCFPPACLYACSFDKDLAYQMGKAMGEEARNMGVAIILGPGVNIKRNPLCGRNFEYYSEDPAVSLEMASSFIKGIESNNVGACVKHFCANSQEKYRFTIDSVVDERTLREIYTKAFEEVVKRKVSSVMCCYNRVNGEFGSESKYLLTKLLRNDWKFDGILMTDWGACNNRVLGVKNNCDIEMPSSYGYNEKKLYQAYQEGLITNEEINRSVKRILKAVEKYSPNKEIAYDKQIHHSLAKYIAADSIILLKNEDRILPLSKDEKVLFVGKFAKEARYQGGGSSHMVPLRLDNIYDNLPKYSNNYLYCDGYDLIKENDEEKIQEAVDLASSVDKVVILAGLFDRNESEGRDRNNMDLPKCQLDLINKITEVNKNVIVTLSIGSVVKLPFEPKVKAILNSYIAGEATGGAILDILFGVTSPSGRLAETFAYEEKDYPSSANYNQTNNACWYTEGIYVGYRYFTSFNKKVLYPFGYGLSYSKFEYSDLKIVNNNITKTKKIRVSVMVKNVGDIYAKEAVLLFIENNKSNIHKPLRELRNFEKVALYAKEAKRVSFELSYDDFSYYDVKLKRFNVDKGIYKIQICKDANTVILEANVERKDNESDFTPHEKSAYNNREELTISDEEFKKLFNYSISDKNITPKRPYTMATPLKHLKKSLVGAILRKVATSKVKKEAEALGLGEEMAETTLEMPVKILSAFGGKQLPWDLAEGLIDISNYKLFTGIKKIIKKK